MISNKCNTIYRNLTRSHISFCDFYIFLFVGFVAFILNWTFHIHCSLQLFRKWFLWIQNIQTLYYSRIPCIDPRCSMLFGGFGNKRWRIREREIVLVFKFTLNESGNSSTYLLFANGNMPKYRCPTKCEFSLHSNCWAIEMQKFVFEITILQWPEMSSTIEQSQILAISLKCTKCTNELLK